MRQDACTSWGAEGYCAILRFWWQLCWSQIHPDLPRLIKEGIIHINTLELVAIVINYYAAIVGFNEKDLKYQPIIECSGDNTTAVAHVTAFTNPNERSRAVSKLLADGHKYSDVGMNVEYYPGKKNYFADAISRGLPQHTMNPKFKNLCPSNHNARICLQVPSSVQNLRL